MNPPRRLRFPVITAIGFLAIGYVAGYFSSPGISSRTAPIASATSPSLKPKPPVSPTLSDANAGASSPLVHEWTTTWAQLSAQPSSPEADEAAGRALEHLAESDPAQALAIAFKERNHRRRTDWMQAALRGWAAVAPEAAMAWIAQLPSIEREGAESAVMDGAARHLEAALALAQRLVQEDPTGARSHAGQLLRVLGHRGDYEASVAFASHLPEEIRSEMLGTAFQYWAQAQPERALDVALKLPEGEARKTALDAAISGWAGGDPSGLAEFALDLSSSEDRTEALQTALREWVQVNPKAASDWIVRFDPKPELDAGAAAVALAPDLLATQPEMAARWAENITRPELKSSTLAAVLREWAAKDPVASLRYAKSSDSLQPPDRVALLTELESRPSVP